MEKYYCDNIDCTFRTIRKFRLDLHREQCKKNKITTINKFENIFNISTCQYNNSDVQNIENIRNVFLYWVGKEYTLISILRNLIYLHSTNGNGYKVHLITDKNINEYIKDIPPYFSKLCPAHQADFVRVNVIYEYGGLWLDSDTIVVDSLDSLFNYIEIKTGFFILENGKILWNGIFGSKKKTLLMSEWKNQLRYILDHKQENIHWNEIGCGILQNIYNLKNNLYENYEIFNGVQNLYPVNWPDCVEEFINKPYDNYKNIIREYQPLLVLVNSVYKNLENKLTAKEILEGNMPLNYFINKSFENIKIQINKLYNDIFIFNYGESDYISKTIIKYKLWEPNITNIFNAIVERNLHHDCTIVDIGCNIGYYSLLCGKNKNITNIYSIDGNTTNINMLSLSCKKNNFTNINIINKCISDEIIYFNPTNKKFAESVGNIGGISYDKTNNYTDITSTTIDYLIEENKINYVLIMKIDIEGGELNALKGAINTLNTDKIKNIIIEISPKFNNDSVEILQILRNNDYDIFNIPNLEVGKYNNNNTYLDNIYKYPILDILYFVNNIRAQTNILATKKILSKYVIYTDWIESYLTKEHFIFVKNLEIFGWEIIKLSDINIENIKNTKSIVLCVTYDDFDISVLVCDNVQIIYKIDDLYPYKEIREKCIKNANMIISPYQYLFDTDDIKKMYGGIDLTDSFHIPYSAVDNFFSNLEFNNNPRNKILVSGCISEVYPLRMFMSNNIMFSECIDKLEHPSYCNYSHNCVNEVYYEKLNEYLCCFVDASAYKYILLKVFEIGSVGSLLLVEDTIESELNNLGFYDNINCIFCNKNNLENKIKWILNTENRDIVDNMRKNCMELVRKKHTTQIRSETFNIIIINNKYIKKNIFCQV